MIIEFNQGNNASAVLADDLGQLGNRITAVIEDLGGDAIVEAVPMADASFQLILPHLNVLGAFTFTATQSFATRELANAWFLAQYALLGWQDLLSVILNSSGGSSSGAALQFFAQNAVLKTVRRVPQPASDGVKLTVRYVFAITQLTTTANAL